jgi:hypothetical protein
LGIKKHEKKEKKDTVDKTSINIRNSIRNTKREEKSHVGPNNSLAFV